MEGIIRSLYAQRSPEWFAERRGKFTSSEIHRLLTSGRRNKTPNEIALSLKGDTRKTVDTLFGSGAETYIYEKINEMITGEIEDFVKGDAIDWGILNEADALALYERVTGRKNKDVGFVQYNDFFGGSPDSEVEPLEVITCIDDEAGITEVKCPYKGANHLKYFNMEDPGMFEMEEPKYYAQIQGNMLATNTNWCDFISYDPRPKLEIFRIKIIRIYRNEEFIENLKYRVDEAGKMLTEKLSDMISMISEEDLASVEEAA